MATEQRSNMDSPSASDRRSARIEAWVAGHWDLILGTASGLCFAASGVLRDDLGKSGWRAHVPPNWIALLLGTVFFVLAGISAARKHVLLSTLEDNLRTSEQDRTILQQELDGWRISTGRIMERLCESFGAALHSTTQERVSIYKQNPDGSFMRLARYSRNSSYHTSGRLKYPAGEGIVGEAWEHVMAQRFLEIGVCRTERQWVTTMYKLTGIPKETLTAMTMKSRSLLARRIDDPATSEGCAVLVFESTRHKVELDPILERAGHAGVAEAFEQIFTEDLGVALAQAVSIMSRLLQQVDPDVATEEGF